VHVSQNQRVLAKSVGTETGSESYLRM
jgi:hypothetical protein